MQQVNLLLDTAHRGSWNMAADEALLQQAEVEGIATLRFYQWAVPTLSLGYFQSHTARQEHAASSDCPLVRRASGGGALVHDRELTYSFTAPIADRLAADVEQLYYAFHETLIELLAEWGLTAELYRGEAASKGQAEPFLCFQRRAVGDGILQGAKILGSAQRRRRGAVLQHGGVLLEQSLQAPQLPGIKELTGVTIQPAELRDRWAPLLQERLQAKFLETTLTPPTSQLAEQIEREKFAHVSWTHKR